MKGIFDTYEDAQRRVDKVKADFGWWPGIITHADGTFTLTHDPEVTAEDIAQERRERDRG